MIRLGINGFGRIGRITLRRLLESETIEVTAINDLAHPSTLAYLLKYDTNQGTLNRDVTFTDNSITVDGKEIKVFAEKDPAQLPWGKEGIDLVIESTGIFTTREKASAHIQAGAKKVIIPQPADKDMKTVVYNVNHEILKDDDQIISVASCTTNCLAPLAKVLNDHFTIITGLMTTIHAYTNSQPLLDTPDRKNNLRASRAAAGNIVPYTTGAAKAVGLVIPELDGKIDGASQRVPVMVGSVTEFFTTLEKRVTVEQINQAMRSSVNDSFGYIEEPIVSGDIIGMLYGSLFDATQTKVISNGQLQLVKTAAWYDNEMSFVAQLVRTAEYFGQLQSKKVEEHVPVA